MPPPIGIFRIGRGSGLTTITITTKYEGVHCYPEAPDCVAYLRQPHRHMFGVRVEVEVFDDDREIEFIMLKHQVDDYIKSHCDDNGVWQMGRLSCEQVCNGILKYLFAFVKWPEGRHWSVMVDEDGENGATVSGKFLKVDFANVDF